MGLFEENFSIVCIPAQDPPPADKASPGACSPKANSNPLGAIIIMTVTVYVLQGKEKRYVGITNNLTRRLAEHRAGHTKGAQIVGQFRLLIRKNFPITTLREKEKSF